MPEMVSLFNGMGGACAALISIVEFNHLIEASAVQDYYPYQHHLIFYQFPVGKLLIILLGLNNWFCFICRQHDCLGKIKRKSKRHFF